MCQETFYFFLPTNISQPRDVFQTAETAESILISEPLDGPNLGMYITVVGGKEITSLEVLYENMRISKEFELDPTFTVYDDKGKKVFRNFLSYNLYTAPMI